MSGHVDITGANSAGFYIRVSWSVKNQDIVNNKTTISYNIKMLGGNSSATYVHCGNIKVSIDGKIVCNIPDRQPIYTGHTISTGTFDLIHSADGKRTFAISGSASIYTFAVNCNGYNDWSLPTIIRKANLISATDFTDATNPVITYSNPAGTSVTLRACISFDGKQDSPVNYVTVPNNAGNNTYTFNISKTAMQGLLDGTTTSNSRTITFILATTINGQVEYSSMSKLFTVTDALPTLTTAAHDTKEGIADLTGSNQRFLKGYNNINVSLKSSAKKGATIVEQRISCKGKKSLTSADGDELSGSFANINSNVLEFYAKDSRGNSTTKEVSLTMVDYFKPSIVLNIKPPSTDGELTFDYNGTFYNQEFSKGISNELKVWYRSRVNDDAMSNWRYLYPTISGNTFNGSESFTGLDYKNTYSYQLAVFDKVYRNGLLGKVETVRTRPVFDWGADDFSFNVPVTVEGKKIAKSSGVTGEDGIHDMALSWDGSSVLVGIDNNDAVKTLVDTSMIQNIDWESDYKPFISPNFSKNICTFKRYNDVVGLNLDMTVAVRLKEDGEYLVIYKIPDEFKPVYLWKSGLFFTEQNKRFFLKLLYEQPGDKSNELHIKIKPLDLIDVGDNINFTYVYMI